MGKRKDVAVEDEVKRAESPVDDGGHRKKHKKKHKKHKKKEYTAELSSETCTSDSTGQPQLKLKIKIGGMTLGTKNIPKIATPEDSSEGEASKQWEDEDSNQPPEEVQPSITQKEADEKEEEEWLEALEKGELDDNGELKKMRDPALLTARQRALRYGTPEATQHLLELPSGYKPKEETEEMIQKRRQRAQKRRMQAAKKNEESKKKTVERLLKREATKQKQQKAKTVRSKGHIPIVTYINSHDKVTLSFPPGVTYPLTPQVTPPPPKPQQKCGVPGCTKQKRYSCSKTGVPLCSLECYRKNKKSHGMA
ncbi:INO80 complex subunit B-like isoform X1 [Branchiostoma floridae x Branchiostoma japonicum]